MYGLAYPNVGLCALNFRLQQPLSDQGLTPIPIKLVITDYYLEYEVVQSLKSALVCP